MTHDQEADPAAERNAAQVLTALRADFPGFEIWTELAVTRTLYVARRATPGQGLHTAMTSDPDELAAALRHAGTPA